MDLVLVLGIHELQISAYEQLLGIMHSCSIYVAPHFVAIVAFVISVAPIGLENLL